MASLFLACVLALAIVAAAGVASEANPTPVIGVLTLPHDADDREYFDAAYVNWLEAAGARIVPISYRQSTATTKAMLAGLNGALLTGGGLTLTPGTPYYETGLQIFEYAKASGGRWPVWGTCQGFQFLSILLANQNTSVLTPGWDSEALPLPLTFLPAAEQSSMYADAPVEVLNILQNEAVTPNYHAFGVAADLFESNAALKANAVLLTKNADRKGKIFGSSLQGRTWSSVVAVQFHPERIPFDDFDADSATPHTASAQLISNYYARFLVNLSRQNMNSLAPAVFDQAVIYNFSPTFTANSSGDSYPDTQTYIFGQLGAYMDGVFGASAIEHK